MLDLMQALDPRIALALHLALSAALIAAVLGIAWLLRERRTPWARDDVYESGIAPGAGPQGPVAAPYFLVAALFVIFDMEAAILFAWAAAARETGMIGFVEAAVFIGVLLAALLYLWMDGALETAPKQRRKTVEETRP